MRGAAFPRIGKFGCCRNPSEVTGTEVAVVVGGGSGVSVGVAVEVAVGEAVAVGVSV